MCQIAQKQFGWLANRVACWFLNSVGNLPLNSPLFASINCRVLSTLLSVIYLSVFLCTVSVWQVVLLHFACVCLSLSAWWKTFKNHVLFWGLGSNTLYVIVHLCRVIRRPQLTKNKNTNLIHLKHSSSTLNQQQSLIQCKECSSHIIFNQQSHKQGVIKCQLHWSTVKTVSQCWSAILPTPQP